MQTKARLRTPIRTKISASALSEVLERFDLVPEGVEPEPDLARVAAGLVHHSPLGAEQVLAFGAFLEVAAAGEEEQRLGVVGLVEAVVRRRAGRRRGRRSGRGRAAPTSSARPGRSGRRAGSGCPPDEAGLRAALLRRRRSRLPEARRAPPGRRRARASGAGLPGSRAAVRSRSPAPCRSGCGPRPLCR